MVMPLYDDNSDRLRTPFLNYILIIINVLVFVLLQQMGAEQNRFTYAWACVPEEIVTGKDLTDQVVINHPATKEPLGAIQHEPNPVSVYLTLLTSMFMHGSWIHLFGNMLFLWIFGDNLEDYLGHFRYLVFYLTVGFLASFAHIATTYLFRMNPAIPSLGASGAISGVLGGYILLFPHRRVTVLLFRLLTVVPAWVAIGLWFLFQIINSLGMLGGDSGGVAYGAHIGGFLAGIALIKVFAVGIYRDSYNRAPPREWRR